MPFSASKNVQHGLQTWVDYDRPWILRRQFLVSEQTASILSNLVAMALTLAGPRLWILLKAFFFWALAHYGRRSKGRSTHEGILGHAPLDVPRLSNLPTPHSQNQPDGPFTHSFSMSDNLATIENSHSELGAALGLIAKVFKLLKTDRIRLFIPSPMSSRHCHSLPKIEKLWNNFIRQPIDVMVPFVLSAAFVGLFVAESSSSVLSARILTDKIALSIPPKCSFRMPLTFDTAIAYTRQCYHAEEGGEGCNFFYNQTINYIEKANETCPFRGKTCAWGRNSAISFDTGLVNAQFLGINAKKKYQFRRKMLCAPLLPDGDFIRTANATPMDPWYRRDASPFQTIIDYSPSPDYDMSSMGRRSNGRHQGMWVGAIVGFQEGSQAIDPLYFPNESINSSYVTIFEIYSTGATYKEFRDDPIFPARLPDSSEWINNDTLPGLLGCVENISICDPDLKKCWNDPEPFDFRAKHLPIWKPQSAIFDDMGPTPDLALALLYSSMSYAFTVMRTGYEPEGISYCKDLQDPRGVWCADLPRNQWKVEARQVFETSLVTMQFNVLDMVRVKPKKRNFGYVRDARDVPSNFQGIDGWVRDVPSNFRGICGMVKFKSTGWQNVSFWGLFGLLFFAAAISLASVKTEKEELWLVLGAVLVYRAFLWGKHQLKSIPWASIPHEIFQFMWALALALARKVSRNC